MMTELLSRTVAEIERLQRDMEERERAAIVAKPGSQRYLEELAAEARREEAAGETRESGERW